jgi:cytochrome c oxidase subunit IV
MSLPSSAPHVLPVRAYLGVFAILIVLTAVTVTVAFQDLGPLNNIVAITIAVTKASLVILYFMHAKYSTRLTKMIISSAFVWLLILITFTLFDFGTRGMLGVPGK